MPGIRDYLREHTNLGKSRYLNYLFRYDMERFFKYSSMKKSGPDAAITEIRVLSHSIEKAMSLPDCRAGFGKDKILRMISLYENNAEQIDKTDPQVKKIVYATIRAYVVFQDANGIDTSFIALPYQSDCENELNIGVVAIPEKKKTDFALIAQSRKSARYFGRGTVSRELVKEAVRIAQTAPSACNRQPCRVYACLDDEVISKVMELHNGIKGFGKPGVVFAITGDLRLYQNELERNTVFVDGGLFAMNLLYALDSLGLVSCPAIWGGEPDLDHKLASLLNIPQNEKTVLLILSGNCPEGGYSSAASSKRNVEDIIRFV